MDAGGQPTTTIKGGSNLGWRILKTAAGLLLLVAAAAKYANVVPILAGDGLLSSRPLLLAVLAMEVAAGVFLLIGDDQKCWWLMFITFTVFSIASSYALVSGRGCNCMGIRMIGPQVMLPIDLVFLSLTLWIRPHGNQQTNQSRLQKIAVPICGALGIVAGVAAAYQSQVEYQPGEPIAFLLADDMAGKTWPLNDRMHPDLKQLAAGKWLALIVRNDCQHCRELLGKYFPRPGIHPEQARTVLFVAGTDQWPFFFDHVAIQQAGGAAIDWADGEPFVASPALFLIEDGTVVQASDGQQADGMMEQLAGSLVD